MWPGLAYWTSVMVVFDSFATRRLEYVAADHDQV